MQVKDIARRMVVHTLEYGKVFVLENRRGKVLRGTRMERPFGGQMVEIDVTPDEDLHVTSYCGAVLYEGITGAEIMAQEVALRLAEAGQDVEYKVEDTEWDNRLASVTVKGDVFDDSISATWSTKLEGRRTTRYLCGTLYRGPFRDKSRTRKGFVKLTQKAALQQVGNLCRMHENRRFEGTIESLSA